MKRLRGDHEATHPTGRWRMGLAGGRRCGRIDEDEPETAGIGQIFAGGGVAGRPSGVDQGRRSNPPLQGEGDHEVVEGSHLVERGTPLRLAYGQPPLLTGEDGLEPIILSH